MWVGCGGLCLVAMGNEKKHIKKLIKSLVNKLVHCRPIHLPFKKTNKGDNAM